MKRFFFLVVFCAALMLIQGCTLHFKATDMELDAERQRIQNNDTYELESVSLFRG